MKKFLSIILSAAYRDRLKFFLDDINETSINKNSFEICILIDHDNYELEKDILEYKKFYNFEIKYAKTLYDYGQSNKNYNYGIFSISDPSTYFIQIVSDRYRFANKGWDLFLKNYVGFVDDDIFFLRTVKYSRHLKPRTSLYEAFCYNETWGFYTRKLMEITNGFPTEGVASHDCGFEMLYYYLRRNVSNSIIRDIPVPFFDDSRVVKSIDSDKSQGKFYFRQALFHLRRTDFFNKSLIENLIFQAKKSSLILKKYNKLDISENKNKKLLLVKKNQKKIIKKISYRARYFDILKSKIDARIGNVHSGTFLIDLLVITQFYYGRNFLKYLLIGSINDNKRYSRFYKYFCRFLLNLICRIFIISVPNYQSALKLFMDKDFVENVLENYNFCIEYKKYYKILGYFIKNKS